MRKRTHKITFVFSFFAPFRRESKTGVSMATAESTTTPDTTITANSDQVSGGDKGGKGESVAVEAPRRICFVCTGNTCRSQMAEALAKSYNIPGCVFGSCGVSAQLGAPANPNAVTALGEIGIDNWGGRSKPINPIIVREVDEFICMTSSHAARIEASLPEDQHGKVRTLLGTTQVSDPIGRGIEVYRQTRDQIAAGIRARFGLD